MLAFSNDYYGMIFRATQSVELFCAYHASVQTTQIYTESPQATVDKHIREWNEMNFPRSIYIDEKDLEERNVPDFLKSH